MTASQTGDSQDLSGRLRQLSADLRQLQEDIKSGNVDPVVLRDFREAMDNARETAWVVQTWLEKQAGRSDPYSLLPLLTAERIRRATQLSRNLAGDLAAVEVTIESEGLTELFAAVESLHEPLAHLFRGGGKGPSKKPTD
jgi:hypothetical protein